MGWVNSREGKRGTKYTAVFRDLQGQQLSAGTFKTEPQAIAAWHRAEEDLESGKVIDRRRGRQTLEHYVEKEWFPNHVIEATTREKYRYLLDRYILPELGKRRLIELLPIHVREWIGRLQHEHGANPPTIRECKTVLNAALTTAMNDRITALHAGAGVKTPAVAKKKPRILTAEQYDDIYSGLGSEVMRLLVETDIESGLRWGELTELRPKDLDFSTGLLTVCRAVVELKAADRPEGVRFLVKDYPKDGEWRQLKLAEHIVRKLEAFVQKRGLGSDDLLFLMPEIITPKRRRRPEELPDPATLGRTKPNPSGRTYRHGTLSAYQAGRCRCGYCRDALAAYRAARRAAGLDTPRKLRGVSTDGHIPNDWFRRNVWNKAVKAAEIPFRVTPHGLRHAHASWLLAGGADLQVVKERLGHGSITTTERYLGTLPNADDAALAALDTVRGRRIDDLEPGGGKAEDVDSRDVELRQMKDMVQQLSAMLNALEK